MRESRKRTLACTEKRGKPFSAPCAKPARSQFALFAFVVRRALAKVARPRQRTGVGALPGFVAGIGVGKDSCAEGKGAPRSGSDAATRVCRPRARRKRHGGAVAATRKMSPSRELAELKHSVVVRRRSKCFAVSVPNRLGHSSWGGGDATLDDAYCQARVVLRCPLKRRAARVACLGGVWASDTVVYHATARAPHACGRFTACQPRL